VLKPSGRLVWIAPAPEGVRPPRTDVETLRPNVIRDHAHLDRMLALLYAGAVRPPTIVRYKLVDASEADRLSESRHLQGELVFEVRRALLECRRCCRVRTVKSDHGAFELKGWLAGYLALWAQYVAGKRMLLPRY
jgi:hypothetical protein